MGDNKIFQFLYFYIFNNECSYFTAMATTGEDILKDIDRINRVLEDNGDTFANVSDSEPESDGDSENEQTAARHGLGIDTDDEDDNGRDIFMTEGIYNIIYRSFDGDLRTGI